MATMASLLLVLNFGFSTFGFGSGGTAGRQMYADLLDAVVHDLRSYVRLRYGDAERLFAMPTRWTAPSSFEKDPRIAVYLSMEDSSMSAFARALEIAVRRDLPMLLFETYKAIENIEKKEKATTFTAFVVSPPPAPQARTRRLCNRTRAPRPRCCSVFGRPRR